MVFDRENPLPHSAGLLFQQYIVDICCRAEAKRLNYLRAYQDDLRAETYQELHGAVKDDSFKSGQTKSGRAVNFTVDSVPDSLVQEGAFGEYFESGALLSSLVKVDPGEAVEVEGMMELDIPILDDATSDPDICQKVLDQSVMLSISDITNVSDTGKSNHVTSRRNLAPALTEHVNVM